MAGSAFRAPSAYEFFYNDAGVTQVTSNSCGDTLKPERVYSLEVEASHRFNIDWIGVADAVLSGQLSRHGLRYAVGVYNILNWRYSLSAAPFASAQMPQQGRSFMFSMTLEH